MNHKHFSSLLALLLSTSAHAADIDSIQQEVVAIQQAVSSHFAMVSGMQTENLRIKFAKLFADIYDKAYTQSQALIEKVNSYPQQTRDHIQAQSWYKDLVDRTAWYKAEAQKYRTLFNEVAEVSRKTEVSYRTTDTQGEPYLAHTEVKSVTESTSEAIREYKISHLTWVFDVTRVTTKYTVTTITYSDGSTKQEKTEEVAQRSAWQDSYIEVKKELVKETLFSKESVRQWRTPEYFASYGLDMIRATAAYEQGWTGKGVTVAVLDTGIDTDHPDIKNITAGYNFISQNNLVEDDHFHGTHVAGIIAAAKNDSGTHGVAFDATIMPLKVLNAAARGSMYDIGDALIFAKNNGAKVANASIGSDFWYSDKLRSVIGYAFPHQTYRDIAASGLLVVVSAGNSGYDCKTGGEYFKCSFPAALPSLSGYEYLKDNWLSVGAVDSTGKMTGYSNKAGVMKDYYLVAPGDKVLSTLNDGGYGTKSGTSMAAPHVTGAAALLFQKFPYLKGQEIAKILLVTATDMGETGVDETYGYGLLNVEAAMRPVGDMNIPLGNTTQGIQTNVSQSHIVAPAAFASALMNAPALQDAVVLDDFDRAYSLDMTEAVGLLASTYSFNNYRTANVGKLIFGLQEISMEGHQPAVFGYQFTPHAHILVGQEKGIFGAVGSGALSMGEGNTWYTRLSYSDKHQNLRYTLNLDYGYSPGHGVSNSYITRVSALHALGFGAKVSTQIDKDELTITLNSPISVVTGSASLSVSNGRTLDGEITYAHSQLGLTPNAREYTLGVSYQQHLNKNQTITWDAGRSFNTNHIEGNSNYNIQASWRARF